MTTKFFAAIAAAAVLTTLAVPAGALPSVPKPTGIEASTLLPVADGCGRGFHYSWRWRRCVRNRGW